MFITWRQRPITTDRPAELFAEYTSIQVQDFAVFVDPPTGFVFVKMPAGWKFVGKVDHATVASLPASAASSACPVAAHTRDISRRPCQTTACEWRP